jgi:hypothetical protein
LADIAFQEEYRKLLTARGLADMFVDTGGLESRIIGALSFGSFRPRAIIARLT